MREGVWRKRETQGNTQPREIRKNRREKENHFGWREELGNAWEEAKMRKYSRWLGNERKRECMRGCSERESEIAREIWREKMNAGRNEEERWRGSSEGREIMKSWIREEEMRRERKQEERNRKKGEERITDARERKRSCEKVRSRNDKINW